MEKDLGVSVEVEGSAKAVTTTEILKVNDEYLSNTASITGNIIELSSKENIDSAILSINYDNNEVKEKNLNENDLSIYYINEKELKLEEVESVVDVANKKVTANLNHFSKYVIGDKNRINSNLKDLDIIFAIDTSGSMDWNDSKNKRIDVCQNLVKKLSDNNYRFGIVSFDSSARPIGINSSASKSYLSNNHAKVISKLDSLRNEASGGTNIANALNVASNMFDKDVRRIIILLTDGDGAGSISSAMANVRSKKAQVYTVGLGNSVNVRLLRDTIAKTTSGQYFHADDADLLENIFKNLALKITVPKIESICVKKDSSGENVKGYTKNLKVISDSGFRREIDGYNLENFSSELSKAGQCFGFSTSSILYYKDKLPMKSNELAEFDKVDYDLTKSDIFKNGKKIYKNMNIQIVPDGIDVKNMPSYYDDESKEIIKLLVWWNYTQDAVLFNNKLAAGLQLERILNIGFLTEELKKGPIEINISSTFGQTSHSIVAQRLLQDIDCPSTYYLEIYDNNYPEFNTYIKLDKMVGDIMVINAKSMMETYSWATHFLSVDVDKLPNFIKKYK